MNPLSKIWNLDFVCVLGHGLRLNSFIIYKPHTHPKTKALPNYSCDKNGWDYELSDEANESSQ